MCKGSKPLSHSNDTNRSNVCHTWNRGNFFGKHLHTLNFLLYVSPPSAREKMLHKTGSVMTTTYMLIASPERSSTSTLFTRV
jgi:hypothetical protein